MFGKKKLTYKELLQVVIPALHDLLLDIEKGTITTPQGVNVKFVKIKELVGHNPQLLKDTQLQSGMISISQGITDGIFTSVDEVETQLKYYLNSLLKEQKQMAA